MKVSQFLPFLNANARGTVGSVDLSHEKHDGLDEIVGILDTNQYDELLKLSEEDRKNRLAGKVKSRLFYKFLDIISKIMPVESTLCLS